MIKTARLWAPVLLETLEKMVEKSEMHYADEEKKPKKRKRIVCESDDDEDD